jgi:transcriptional regulator with XRE-family HTH domain
MVSDKVRALLALAGKRNIDLAALYGVSKQSMNNKLTNNRFSADDLIRIAAFTGCKVAFVLPDGQNLFLDEDDLRADKTPADDTTKSEQ